MNKKYTHDTAAKQQPDQATQKAIEILEEAKNAVREIVRVRQNEKMSYTRATNAAKEINEIIKVLKLYIPNEC